MPGIVAQALHAFRQTDHRDAVSMRENFDGDHLGQDTAAGRALNFDPSRHLLYLVHDFNGDRSPEVLLLWNWMPLRGNAEASGVVMLRQPGTGTWRIGCDIGDWGEPSTSPGGIRLLDSRGHGWRNFRTSEGVYHWRPVPGQPRTMECHAVAPWPPPRRR